MGNSHSHRKLLHRVEEAYINETVEKAQSLTTTPSIDGAPPPHDDKTIGGAPPPHEDKTVIGGPPPHDEKEKKSKSSRFQSLSKQLWKEIEHESNYLNESQAKKFFEESYDYFNTLLQSHGTYFNPNIPKDQIISEWISAFDIDKDKKISFNEFVHALQILALATHPEVGDLKENENPIIHETFTYDFFIPPHLKKFTHDDKGVRENKEHLPLELTGLGIEVVVDGINGSGVRTLVQIYAGSLTTNNYAQCNRDIFNKGASIPIKVYLHPQRDYYDGDYLPVSHEYPFRFHLIVLVFDLTVPVTDKEKAILATRISMIKKYLDHTYEKVPHPPLLFLGNKMEEVDNLVQVKKDYIELAEKYNAMFSCVSAKTGLFVSKSFRHALVLAVGNRFGYAIH